MNCRKKGCKMVSNVCLGAFWERLGGHTGSSEAPSMVLEDFPDENQTPNVICLKLMLRCALGFPPWNIFPSFSTSRASKIGSCLRCLGHFSAYLTQRFSRPLTHFGHFGTSSWPRLGTPLGTPLEPIGSGFEQNRVFFLELVWQASFAQ